MREIEVLRNENICYQKQLKEMVTLIDDLSFKLKTAEEQNERTKNSN